MNAENAVPAENVGDPQDCEGDPNARLLDRFTNRFHLEGTLTTRTGLHIGAGRTGDPLATDAAVVRDASGRPFIPGASLKGVLRSAAESLLRGVESRPDAEEGLWACDFLAGDDRENPVDREPFGRHPRHLPGPCVPSATLQKLQNKHPFEYREVAEKVWKRSCWVCRLFGSLALSSRVRFPDLPAVPDDSGELPPLELRNGVGIDRDRELAADGVLYDFEAVPPGTVFDLEVILDNVTEAELGFVLYLFEQLGEGNLSLGGKTSRGLGRVRIEWTRIRETTLEKDNPFASMLSTRDLLAPPEDASEGEPEDAEVREPELPESGSAEDWRRLVEILREMGEVDTTTLGSLAADVGLGRRVVNEKLGLGLPERARQVWPRVLEILEERGFLERRGEDLYFLGSAPEVADSPVDENSPAKPDRDPALQELYNRYVDAMARLWEEAVA